MFILALKTKSVRLKFTFYVFTINTLFTSQTTNIKLAFKITHNQINVTLSNKTLKEAHNQTKN